MLVIISIIILAFGAVLLGISKECKTKKQKRLIRIISICTLVFSVLGLGLAVFIPDEYDNEVIFESSSVLTPILDDKSVYVLRSNDTYIYEVTYPTSKGRVETQITVSADSCTIVEEENCITPRVEIYHRNIKNSLWKLGSGTKIEYVIYVPNGTVAID